MENSEKHAVVIAYYRLPRISLPDFTTLSFHIFVLPDDKISFFVVIIIWMFSSNYLWGYMFSFDKINMYFLISMCTNLPSYRSTFPRTGALFMEELTSYFQWKCNYICAVRTFTEIGLLIPTFQKSHNIMAHLCHVNRDFRDVTLLWRHNEHDSVSNHQPNHIDCKSGRHILWHCTSSL